MCNSALGLQMHLRLNYLSIYLSIVVGYHVQVVGFGRKSLKLEFESKMERQFISALRPEHFSDNLD